MNMINLGVLMHGKRNSGRHEILCHTVRANQFSAKVLSFPSMPMPHNFFFDGFHHLDIFIVAGNVHWAYDAAVASHAQQLCHLDWFNFSWISTDHTESFSTRYYHALVSTIHLGHTQCTWRKESTCTQRAVELSQYLSTNGWRQAGRSQVIVIYFWNKDVPAGSIRWLNKMVPNLSAPRSIEISLHTRYITSHVRISCGTAIRGICEIATSATLDEIEFPVRLCSIPFCTTLQLTSVCA